MNHTLKKHPLVSIASAICAVFAAAPAQAIDFQSKDWTFSVDGNVNVHYIYSNCESPSSTKRVDNGLACAAGPGGSSSVSNVGNGLLPAAITFGVATTQAGIDIAGHFGFYPGIATNDGGSPNLQQNPGALGTNTALGTTGLDVRQVYMTFGTKEMGTFTLGRNFGLFGFDAIINDMTIPGVGGAGSASSAAPSNTTLGSIGLGYIYVDTLAQMNYTTPDFAGFNLTLGIYDPLNSPSNPGTNQPKKAPGFHGKATYTLPFNSDTKLYLSSTFIEQKQHYLDTGGISQSYTSFGFDVFAKFDWKDFEAAASYYHGTGLGTTGLFLAAVDAAGNKRDSDGYLLQATYKLGKVKLGVNYGVSELDCAGSELAASCDPLVKRNSKITGGAYYSLTKNLMLLGEVTNVQAKAHDHDKNTSTNVNVGAFLSF